MPSGTELFNNHLFNTKLMVNFSMSKLSKPTLLIGEIVKSSPMWKKCVNLTRATFHPVQYAIKLVSINTAGIRHRRHKVYTLNVILHFPSPVKVLQLKQFSKKIATLATFKANLNHVSIEMHIFGCSHISFK